MLELLFLCLSVTVQVTGDKNYKNINYYHAAMHYMQARYTLWPFRLTFVYCVKTAKLISKLFSMFASAIILLFSYPTL